MAIKFRVTCIVMLCQMCHENPATTHIRTTVNGKTQEYMLCSTCANKNGYLFSPKNFDFSVGDLLSGFLGNIKGKEAKHSLSVKKCPQCGMVFNEFSKTGKLGCAKCYDTFKDELIPMIERIHGKSTHVKRQAQLSSLNKSMDVSEKIKKLQSEMQKAIDVQDFENAARIRDEIKELKRQVSDDE